MEIEIRTHDEFQRDRVTIRITSTQGEAEEVSRRLTGGSEHALYSAALDAERELVQARRQIEELERQLATAQQAREIETRRAQEYDLDRHTERDRADRAQAREKELEAQVERFRKAHVCTDRCTDNAHVAFEGNRLVKDLERELEHRFTVEQVEDAKAGARADERARLDREVIKPLNEKLSRIHAAVLGTELAREITTYRDSSAATLLVEALTDVRRITGVTSV
jgi:hypothetical protein